MINSDRLGSILTLKGAFGVQNACAFCDSRLRRSVLWTQLTTRILRLALRANSRCSFVRIGFLPIRRASVGWRARLGSNFRPLLPKYNATSVCNQDLTEYHESKHSRKMFFDNV